MILPDLLAMLQVSTIDIATVQSAVGTGCIGPVEPPITTSIHAGIAMVTCGVSGVGYIYIVGFIVVVMATPVGTTAAFASSSSGSPYVSKTRRR